MTAPVSAAAPVAAAPPADVPRRRRALLGNRKFLAGLIILGLFAVLAIAGPWIARYDPDALSDDILQSPSVDHWLGTTSTGQDVASQLLVGARSVLFVAFAAGVLASVLSVLIGVVGGFLSGWGDEVLSMVTNVFLIIPAIPLIIIVASQLPSSGDLTVALVISLTGWAWGSRVIRAQTLSLRRRDFVESARANGEPMWRVIVFEILPHLSAVIVTSFIGTVMFAILAQTTLAFLGVTSGTAWSWGTILYWAQNNQALAQDAWWWFVPAGLCVALVGTALSLINFGMDELVNPRLRQAGVRPPRRSRIKARIGFTPVVRRQDAPRDERPAPSADEVLDIRGLGVDYGFGAGAVTALDGISLTLRRGEILGLAGESGCGKSTLAYAATRLLPPPGVVTGGSVVLTDHAGAGRDLLAMTAADLRRTRWQDIAVVFQGAMNSLNPVLRVEAQIVDAIAAHDPRSTRRDRRARAAELMTMVGIPTSRLAAYPHQLSGGMRQRVMIAMALALDPDVLIMDEPTTALDVVMQRQIVEQLLSLRHRLGFSVVFITHDMSLLIETADRIAIMYAGEIVEHGPAEQLYRNPRHPYTRGLLASFPPLSGPRREMSGIPGSPPDLANLPTGCRFHARCAFAMPSCSTTTPQLTALPDGGEVACLLHDLPADEVPPEFRVPIRPVDTTDDRTIHDNEREVTHAARTDR